MQNVRITIILNTDFTTMWVVGAYLAKLTLPSPSFATILFDMSHSAIILTNTKKTQQNEYLEGNYCKKVHEMTKSKHKLIH